MLELQRPQVVGQWLREVAAFVGLLPRLKMLPVPAHGRTASACAPAFALRRPATPWVAWLRLSYAHTGHASCEMTPSRCVPDTTRCAAAPPCRSARPVHRRDDLTVRPVDQQRVDGLAIGHGRRNGFGLRISDRLRGGLFGVEGSIPEGDEGRIVYHLSIG